MSRIQSLNRTDTGGFTVGTSVTKDMATATRSIAHQGSFYPGTTAAPAENASRWSDWGNDIFDQWGFFYIYNPATDAYYSPIFSNINQADGTLSTETFSNVFGNRTFTITHGYPVQGIYKMDISVADNNTFVYGATGNMGSDGNTNNTDQTTSFTLGGTTRTLY